MEYEKASFEQDDYINQEFSNINSDYRSITNNKPSGVFSSTESSIAVGAKTIAGVGIGLLLVVAGTTALAAVSEAVIIPSLLIKLAGGIAGGGVGMAKGLSDERKTSKGET